MGAYKEALEGLDLKKLLKNFWKYEPPTPEEIETLNDCRSVNLIIKLLIMLFNIS